MEITITEAKLMALTAAVTAVLSAHQDKEALLRAFDFCADAARDHVLHSSNFSEHMREVHDESLETFRLAITSPL